MNKKLFLTIITAGLLIFGIFIKACYVNYTDTWERQHDVIGFGAQEGHAAYIEYIAENHRLPDFDPREKWGFFQPPLHHIISAGIIEISSAAGLDATRCQENTQLATLAYMIVIMLLTAYMFAKSKGQKVLTGSVITEGFVVTAAIVFVHPIFTLLSGSINNDALALILSVVSIVIASKWADNPGMINTVLLALAIGLAMFAKLTGGLVAVPIGILMVVKIFGYDGGFISSGSAKIKLSDRVGFFIKNYLLKCVLFAVIVVPVGLFWTVRNKIMWDMPINYIPPVGENFPDSITLADRIFNLSTGSVYTMLINRGDAFDEYSLPLLIIKTSLFSEFSFADVSRWLAPVTIVMFVTAAMLILTALYATAYMMISGKSKLDTKWKILLFGTYITYLIAYLGFAVTHRNFSAGDFRYAAICIVCEGIFTGLFTDTVKNRAVKYAIMAVALVFAVSSFGTYLILGLKS